MQPLKAQVRNGRLVLDVPTDLPEGEVIDLVPAHDAEMDAAERALLDDSLRESIEQMNQGQLIDADEALATSITPSGKDEVIVLSVWGAPRRRGPKL